MQSATPALALGILVAASVHAAWCQDFEVVAVRPNKSGSGNSSSNTNRGRFVGTNVSLKQLIVRAYDLNDYQVEGPDWLGSERFDVNAKFPDDLPQNRDERDAARRVMMQHMLADRFKLAFHWQSKTFPVYGLIAGKSGVKFQQVPDGDSHNQSSGNTHYKGTTVSLAMFAGFLSHQMDLPVIDMTGLKGFYNLTLDWVPETRRSDDIKSAAPSSSAIPSGPELPEALQAQLGLKLEKRKAPIAVLIVDHAERVPTEN